MNEPSGIRESFVTIAGSKLDGRVCSRTPPIAEIFDGDPPFTPGGCIAQAWSVAETLRAWHELPRA
jgi:hypothetical protein